MELNDFQYNWYLHFEEENEKSIVGLPFDSYFEAQKYDSETILNYVSQARRTSNFGTASLFVVDYMCKIMEIIPQLFLDTFNVFDYVMKVTSYSGDDYLWEFVFYACLLTGVFIYHLLGVQNPMGLIVILPFCLLAGTMIVVLVTAILAFLWTIPHTYTYVFTALLMSASISSTVEVSVDNQNVNSFEAHHTFTSDDHISMSVT